MLSGLSGATRIHLIVGDPVAQTKSPAGLTREFSARGIDAVCIPMQVAAADVDAFFAAAKRVQNIDGIVVTVPHKLAATRHCDALSERSRTLAAWKIAAGSADPTGCDLVVNATPLGMAPGDQLPVDAARIAPGAVVADLVTKPAVTPLLVAARERGAQIVTGEDMFAPQAGILADFLLAGRG